MNTTSITRQQLIGCWKDLVRGGSYIELREDGSARKKLTWRGSSNVDSEIQWRHIEPAGLELSYRQSGEQRPSLINEYRVKYFDGKQLEWWHVRMVLQVGGEMTESVVENVMHTTPVCWKRSRPPKSWQ